MWITVIFSGTALLFLVWALIALWHLRWVRRLPPIEAFGTGVSPRPSPASRICCSVIIAARDEEARIEQTIRHLLAQRGVGLELIVVDDRSTDRTSEILRQLAKEDDLKAWRRQGSHRPEPRQWIYPLDSLHLS
jgi:chlorobactene glucosyltransferase